MCDKADKGDGEFMRMLIFVLIISVVGGFIASLALLPAAIWFWLGIIAIISLWNFWMFAGALSIDFIEWRAKRKPWTKEELGKLPAFLPTGSKPLTDAEMDAFVEKVRKA